MRIGAEVGGLHHAPTRGRSPDTRTVPTAVGEHHHRSRIRATFRVGDKTDARSMNADQQRHRDAYATPLTAAEGCHSFAIEGSGSFDSQIAALGGSEAADIR